MFAVADALGVGIEAVEAMPATTFAEWLAYFEIKAKRARAKGSGVRR